MSRERFTHPLVGLGRRHARAGIGVVNLAEAAGDGREVQALRRLIGHLVLHGVGSLGEGPLREGLWRAEEALEGLAVQRGTNAVGDCDCGAPRSGPRTQQSLCSEMAALRVLRRHTPVPHRVGATGHEEEDTNLWLARCDKLLASIVPLDLKRVHQRRALLGAQRAEEAHAPNEFVQLVTLALRGFASRKAHRVPTQHPHRSTPLGDRGLVAWCVVKNAMGAHNISALRANPHDVAHRSGVHLRRVTTMSPVLPQLAGLENEKRGAVVLD
mmetsp:Transcript_90455/g.255328  ORF Transcript_90455/g.255328 Transcript_90455/m.255328 type:complete len:270 (+) Transcript_90455:413-1222(+)